MNSSADEDQVRKEHLVKTINQFLLQNALPVTAAALRKECEKLWRKKENTKTKKEDWWTVNNTEQNDAEGNNSLIKLEALLALERAKDGIPGGHSSEKTNKNATTTTSTNTISAINGTNSAAVADATQQQVLSTQQTKSTTKKSGGPSQHQLLITNTTPAMSPLKQPRHQPKNRIALRQRRLSSSSVVCQNNRKTRRRPNADGTEEQEAAEEENNANNNSAGPATTLSRKQKFDSAYDLSQSPPDDPVSARQHFSLVDQHQQQQQREWWCSNCFNTGQSSEGGKRDHLLLEMSRDISSSSVNKAIGTCQQQKQQQQQQQWLCSNLDYAALGRALLLLLQSNNNPPSRDSALLVQALRQQLTKAGSLAAGASNLDKMIANDFLMLYNRKQSVLSLFLCPDPAVHGTSVVTNFNAVCPPHASAAAVPVTSTTVDLLKDQLSRLLNVVASFHNGRDYLLSVANGRQLLYEVSMALRTKRVHGLTVANLLASLQKMSIRPCVRKELVLNGMVEWLCRWLSESYARQSLGAIEFGTALLHNLCLCPISHQTTLRHKDDLLVTVLLLIRQARSVQLFDFACATLFLLFTLPRVRATARERGDAERTLTECMHHAKLANAISGFGGYGTMPLTDHQRQQLAALLHMVKGGADGMERELSAAKKRANCERTADDEERLQFPDYLEAEIDSTDPLVPSLNDLFGDELLSRHFLLQPSATMANPSTAAGVGVVPRVPSSASTTTVVVVPTQQRHSISRCSQSQQQQFGYIEDDRESIPGVVPVPPQARPVAGVDPPHPQPSSGGKHGRRLAVAEAPAATSAVNGVQKMQQKKSGDGGIGNISNNNNNKTRSIYYCPSAAANGGTNSNANTDDGTTVPPPEFRMPLTGIGTQFEEQRSTSMSSQLTFVVENNARRPLLGATEFLTLVALMNDGKRYQRVKQCQKKTMDVIQSFDNLDSAQASSEDLLPEHDDTSWGSGAADEGEATSVAAPKRGNAAVKIACMAKIVKAATQTMAHERGGGDYEQQGRMTRMAQMMPNQRRTGVTGTKMVTSVTTTTSASRSKAAEGHYDKWSPTIAAAEKRKGDNARQQQAMKEKPTIVGTKRIGRRRNVVVRRSKTEQQQHDDDDDDGKQSLLQLLGEEEDEGKRDSDNDYLRVFAARPKVSRTPPNAVVPAHKQ